MKDKIEKWYKHGLWSLENVSQSVDKGILTEEDLAEILAE